MNRVYLVDGSALAYRSYFAFLKAGLSNSKGEQTGAVYGFITILLKFIKDTECKNIAVVFDAREKTFRHEMYPEYKATREKMPDDLVDQYPRIIDSVKKMGIPMLSIPGYEADDVIGTLSRKYEKEGREIYIFSKDKDFMQLVSDKIFLIDNDKKSGGIKISGKDAVKEKFGVLPERVIDVLALMGDSSDNVPGIAGIGPKTAGKLVSEKGPLESIYEKLDSVKSKSSRKKLEEGKENAYLSRKLVTIHTDLDVDVSPEEIKFSGEYPEEFAEFLKENELNSLLSSIGASARSADHKSSKKEYNLVNKEEELESLCKELKHAGTFAIDTETTGLNPVAASLVGISVSFKEHEGIYIPVAHKEGRNIPEDALKKYLVPLIESDKIKKVGHNVKYDMLVLENYGIKPSNFFFDTMVASYVLDPTLNQHGLSALSLRFLDYKMIPIEDLIGKGKSQKTFDEVPVTDAVSYAAEDADITFMLYGRLKTEIERNGFSKIFENLEMPLVGVLMHMERSGVLIDSDALSKMAAEFKGRIGAVVKKIYKEAGKEFNINSTKQLSAVLFEDLGIKPVKKTKTGHSTDVEVLKALASEHSIAAHILEYRHFSKLLSTYVENLPGLVDKKTGRLHASFNQTVTATGRLSSSDPNLQNIPVKTEDGREIRRAFRAGRGNRIISADYSQIELRVLAHLSEDKNLCRAFREGEDIHNKTAAALFGGFPDMINYEMRDLAKIVNFSVIYGKTPYGLSKQLGISVKEASDFIDNYFSEYPSIKDFVASTLEEAKENGSVETILGRRRPLPDINSRNRTVRQFAERTAVNTRVQGSAADLIKKAMIDIFPVLKKDYPDILMIMQVHDELVFEIPKGSVDAFKKVLKNGMEKALSLKVPLLAEIGVGKTWYEAH